ncbi:serine protease [Nesidiocoris tenuis]|uniref:Serine protease n=1 Tax=Nesidiocoris tenuis TaxID=355587 RepID=A0ABN7AFZ4_9HEMI|nr:serine protease [Nesidiocoris tenuis]
MTRETPRGDRLLVVFFTLCFESDVRSSGTRPTEQQKTFELVIVNGDMDPTSSGRHARLAVTLYVLLVSAGIAIAVKPRQYVTDDAVVLEGGETASPNSLDERSKRQFENWPLITVGPCYTSTGRYGRCTSFRHCFPYFKLPDLNTWDSWVLGMYDTCTYFTATGKQMFGVCCEKPASEPPVETTTTTTAKPELPPVPPYPPEGIRPANPVPPNWPPPLPTHPPDHTIPPLPTHPPSPGYPGIVQPQPPTTSRPTVRPPATRPPATQPPRPPVRPPTRPPTQWPGYPPPTAKPPVTPAPPRPPQPQPPSVDPPPTAAQCGAKNGYQDQERIVGGQNADLGEWPWIVALFNSGRQFCGGSLIDNSHILTAAHCVAHMSAWDVARLTVNLGDHNIKTTTETRHVVKKVKRVVRHRGFDSNTLYNDIAILTLESPVTFSNQIRAICLPSGGSTYAGKIATVIGWGSLSENGPQPSILQEVNIPVWNNRECRSKYGPAAPGGIVEHFLCAGEARRDSCSGDSGGPLMVNDGKWTQIGIVSWGIGCGKGQYPGVYTRVSHFLPWIAKNIK